MGMVYYVGSEQVGEIPRLHEQGPDVLDDFTFHEFKQRLKRFHGEIKGVLTRGRVISGIGNAWSDEILFAARIYPFKRRKALSDDELRRLYDLSRKVVEDAVPVVRERMGDSIHLKVRDFLQVHNKGGQPCPRCGNTISRITANRRITAYCRRCQPGMPAQELILYILLAPALCHDQRNPHLGGRQAAMVRRHRMQAFLAQSRAVV